MASTTDRQAATGFLILLASVYVVASVAATTAVTTEMISNGVEVWSVVVLAGALAATALWGVSGYRFSKSYKRVNKKTAA